MPEAIIKSHCEGMRMEEWEEFETIVVKNLSQIVYSGEVWEPAEQDPKDQR